MPSRIIRDGILTSDRVNALTVPAELFYRRLMSVVDDFGRYDGRIVLLKVACFPLRVDVVREADIPHWITECEKAGLLVFYAVDGKPFLEMVDFRQSVRAKRSKYPPPPDGWRPRGIGNTDATQAQSECNADATHMRPSLGLGLGLGLESNLTAMSSSAEKPPNIDVISLPLGSKNTERREQAKQILGFLNAKTTRNFRMVDANLGPVMARMKEGATIRELRAVIARKCREWGADEKMSPYLRPATLFNATKFAQYVGEVPPAEMEAVDGAPMP